MAFTSDPYNGWGNDDDSLWNTGDFYAEPNDTTRGVSLGAVDVSADFADFDGKDSAWGKSAAWPEDGFTGTFSSSFGSEPAPGSHTDRFQKGDVAPPLPEDPDCLGCSILELNAPLWQLGNGVLDFLASKVDANVEKVRRAKCTIKAEVFVDGVACLVKVRLYAGADDSHTIEFQRRRGDCCVFQSVFGRAIEFLKKRLGLPVQETAPSRSLFQPPPMDAGFEPVPPPMPLLDLARCGMPMLQQEAALGLGQFVKMGGASDLCNPEAAAALGDIAGTGTVPAAQLMASLACAPEASALFHQHGLMELVIDQQMSSTPCALAHLELSRAVSSLGVA